MTPEMIKAYAKPLVDEVRPVQYQIETAYTTPTELGLIEIDDNTAGFFDIAVAGMDAGITGAVTRVVKVRFWKSTTLTMVVQDISALDDDLGSCAIDFNNVSEDLQIEVTGTADAITWVAWVEEKTFSVTPVLP
jgi:hypothetical protein